MNSTIAVLESWDRQCTIISNLTSLLTPELLEAKPSEDGTSIAFHLAHIHSTRRYWHMKATDREEPVGPSLFTVSGEEWIPSTNIEEIRDRLVESGTLVKSWVATELSTDTQQTGNYDHPVFYLQHMLWHEGWHAGLIMLALRRAGHEPSEQWECENIWDLWRQPD
ncbi:MAG: DinB family protein [Fimbriimonadales bacterium]